MHAKSIGGYGAGGTIVLQAPLGDGRRYCAAVSQSAAGALSSGKASLSGVNPWLFK